MLLEIENLNLTFDVFEGHAHVLHDVSLSVTQGERVAVVGESGCGKSVTLRVILGLLDERRAAIRGRMVFDDTTLGNPRDYRRLRGREITMIFQDPTASLNPTFTVGDQLAAIIRRGGKITSRAEIRELAVRELQRVAIRDPERVLTSYPFQLSGGLNQRILITMALINRPRLVLADEPGTALDVSVQRQTLELMTTLVKEDRAAVLLITHNLGVVREFSQRIYVMYAGTIVESGTTAEIFSSPLHPYTRALFDSVPKLTGGVLPKGIEGTVPDYTAPPEGCRFHPRCPFARASCKKPVAEVRVSDTHSVRCVLYAQEEAVGV